MTIEKHVGSLPVRALTCALAALCVGGIVLQRGAPPGGAHAGWFYGTVAAGVLALMGLVHSSQGLYQKFLVFSHGCQKVVITLLFGTCYLLIVPVFAVIVLLRDPLRLRAREPSWIRHPQDPVEPDWFERSG